MPTTAAAPPPRDVRSSLAQRPRTGGLSTSVPPLKTETGSEPLADHTAPTTTAPPPSLPAPAATVTTPTDILGKAVAFFAKEPETR
jgi:hypothetical protein